MSKTGTGGDDRAAMLAKIEHLRGMDLAGNLTIGFNFDKGVLTNVGGLPLSRTEAKAIRLLIAEHLKKSAEELLGISLGVARKNYPSLEDYGSFEVEDYL